MAAKAHEARAAQRTIMAQMDDCIDEHATVKGKLDACELPSGLAACGSPPSVVHVHHQALVTLVSGQRILLQERRDRLDSELRADEDSARRRVRDRPVQDDDGGGAAIEVDRKRGILKANGLAAVVMAVVVAVVGAILAKGYLAGGAH